MSQVENIFEYVKDVSADFGILEPMETKSLTADLVSDKPVTDLWAELAARGISAEDWITDQADLQENNEIDVSRTVTDAELMTGEAIYNDNEYDIEYLDDSVDELIPSIPEPTRHVSMPKQKNFHCDICQKNFSYMSTLRRHQQNHKSSKMKIKKKVVKHHKCRKCKKEFLTFEECDVHKTKHTHKNPFTCDFCGVTYGNRTDILRHLNNHIDLRPQCTICQKRLQTNALLYIHIIKTHAERELQTTTEKRLTCRYCGKKMASSVSCQRHEQSHFGGEFECEHCGKHFGQKTQLVNHIHLHHLGIKRFNCHMCDKSYTSKLNLGYHTRGHYNDRRYECDICGKRSLHPITHNNHVKTHTGGDFVCPHCGRKYIRKFELMSHLPVHEGNAKPYQCTLCTKSYIRRENFNLHLSQIHGQGSRVTYTCTVEKCGKVFATRAALRKHMTTHAASDDTNICQQCGLIFYNSEDLVVHKISAHSRPPAFRCTLCSEGFDEQILYRRHMIVKHRTVLKVDNT